MQHVLFVPHIFLGGLIASHCCYPPLVGTYVFGQLVTDVMHSAVLKHHHVANTIQYLGSDYIMSRGIKSSAFLRVEHPFPGIVKFRYVMLPFYTTHKQAV